MSRVTRYRKRYSRQFRILKIQNVLYHWRYHNGLTMTQLAFCMQMKPSTHLMSILKGMQADGVLIAAEAPHRPNITKYIWSLSPEAEVSTSNRINYNGRA